MSSTDPQRTRIVLLKGASNYDEWKSVTETILIKQGYWDMIEPEDPESSDTTTKRSKADKAKAWAEINALLEYHIRPLLPDGKDPKILWDILSELYQSQNNHYIYTAYQALRNA